MIHIVLYRPEKPQNTGNIMRTCVAIHATLHIIGPITFSVENKDLQRVGMDYIDDLKMEFHPTYEDFVKDNPNADIYYKINDVHIELYTDAKDPEVESRVEAVLDEHGVFYDKTEVWIDTEKLYEDLYSFQGSVK